MLVAHAQGHQQSLSRSDKHGEGTLHISEAGIAFAISAGMLAGDGDTVSLVLEVINATNQARVFAPGEIVVILPNGHSYRPFSQVDVLAQTYEVKANRKQKKGRAEPPALPPASEGASCSADGDNATCATTSDLSTEAWSARHLALVSMITGALHDRKSKKYIQQVKRSYLVSREIPPGETVTGYVDLYLEDIHNGPFTVRVPAGGSAWVAPAPGRLAIQKTTYDFRFGPELVGDPRQSARDDTETQ